MQRAHTEREKQASRILPTYSTEHRATPELEPESSHSLASIQQARDASMRQGHLDQSPIKKEDSITPEEQHRLEKGGKASNASYEATEEKSSSGLNKTLAVTQATARTRLEDLLRKQYKNVLKDLEQLLEERINTIANTLVSLRAKASTGVHRTARTSNRSKKLPSPSTQEGVHSTVLQTQLSEIQKLRDQIRTDAFRRELLPQVLGRTQGLYAELLYVAERACQTQGQDEAIPPLSDDVAITHHMKQILQLCALPLCYHDCLPLVRKPAEPYSGLTALEAKANICLLLKFMKRVYEQAIDDEYSYSADPEGAAYLLSLLLSIHADPGPIQDLLDWFVIPIVAVETPSLIRLRSQDLTDRQAEKIKSSITAGERAAHKGARHHAYKIGYRQLTFSLLACDWPWFEPRILAPLLVEQEFSNDMQVANEGLLKAARDRSGRGKMKADWRSDLSALPTEENCLKFTVPNGFKSSPLVEPFEPSSDDRRRRLGSTPPAHDRTSDCSDKIAAPVYWLSELRLYTALLTPGYSISSWGKDGLQCCSDLIDTILDNFDQLIQKQIFVSFILTYLNTKALITGFGKLPASMLPVSHKSFLNAFCGEFFRAACKDFNTFVSTSHDLKDLICGVNEAIDRSYEEVLRESQTLSQLIQRESQTTLLWNFDNKRQGGQHISTRSWTESECFAKNIILHLLPKLSGLSHFPERTDLVPNARPFFVLFETQLRELATIVPTDSATPPIRECQFLPNDELASLQKVGGTIQSLSSECDKHIREIKKSLERLQKAALPSKKKNVSWLWRNDLDKLRRQHTKIREQLRASDHAKLLLYCVDKGDRLYTSFCTPVARASLDQIRALEPSAINAWVAETELRTQFEEYESYFDEAAMYFPDCIWFSLSSYALAIEALDEVKLTELEGLTKELESLTKHREGEHFQLAQQELVYQHKEIRNGCRKLLQVAGQRLSELSVGRDKLSQAITQLEKDLSSHTMLPIAIDTKAQGGLQATSIATGPTLKDLDQTRVALLETCASLSEGVKALRFELSSQTTTQLKRLLQETKQFMSQHQLIEKGEEASSLIWDHLPERIKARTQKLTGEYLENDHNNCSTLFTTAEWEQLSCQFESSKIDAYQLHTTLHTQELKLRPLARWLNILKVTHQNRLNQTRLEQNIRDRIQRLEQDVHDRMQRLERIKSADHSYAVTNLSAFIQTLTQEISSIPAVAPTSATTETGLLLLDEDENELLRLLVEQHRLHFPALQEPASDPNHINSTYEGFQSILNEYQTKLHALADCLSDQISARTNSLATQISGVIQKIFEPKAPLQTEPLDYTANFQAMLADLYSQYEDLSAYTACCAQAGIPLHYDMNTVKNLGRDIFNCQNLLQCQKDQRKRSASAQILPQSVAQTTLPHSPEEIPPVPGYSEGTVAAPAITGQDAPGHTKPLEDDITTILEQLEEHILKEEALLDERVCLEALIEAAQNKDSDHQDQVATKIQEYCVVLEEQKNAIAALLDQLFKSVLRALAPYTAERSEAFQELLRGTDTSNGNPEIELALSTDQEQKIDRIRIRGCGETGSVTLSGSVLKDLPRSICQALDMLTQRYASDRRRVSSFIFKKFKQHLQTLTSDKTPNEQDPRSRAPDLSPEKQQLSSLPCDATPETPTRKYSEVYSRRLTELSAIARAALGTLECLISKQGESLKTQKSPEEAEVEIRALSRTCETAVQDLQFCITYFDWEFQHIDVETRHMHLNRMKIQGALDQLNGTLRVLESHVLVKSSGPYPYTAGYVSHNHVFTSRYAAHAAHAPTFWNNPQHVAAANIPLKPTQIYLVPTLHARSPM